MAKPVTIRELLPSSTLVPLNVTACRRAISRKKKRPRFAAPIDLVLWAEQPLAADRRVAQTYSPGERRSSRFPDGTGRDASAA